MKMSKHLYCIKSNTFDTSQHDHIGFPLHFFMYYVNIFPDIELSLLSLNKPDLHYKPDSVLSYLFYLLTFYLKCSYLFKSDTDWSILFSLYHLCMFWYLIFTGFKTWVGNPPTFTYNLG